MIKKINKKQQTQKRHLRLRSKLQGTAQSPRLAVYRSIKHIYAQVIDDQNRITLTSASSKDKELNLKHGGNIEAAKLVGQLVAKRALDKGIKNVVFDRGGFLFHGRIQALANSARETGLVF